MTTGTSDTGCVGEPGTRQGCDLFAYGTLMFDEVVEGLIGRRLVAVPASLRGWRAVCLPGRVYPGLVPAPGRAARGVLVTGLTVAEWAVLDEFEGWPYLLREVRPALEDPGAAPGACTRVLTYAWRDLADVEDRDWDPSWFAATWLDHYARRVRDL